MFSLINKSRLIGENKKNLSIEIGESSITDYFSYSGLKEFSDYLIVDDQFIRTVYISGYPLVANSGWLDEIVNFNHNSDISYHIHEVSSLSALPKLHRKITELESTKRAMLKNGKLIGSEITDPLSSAIDLRDKIMRGQEKLFQVSIYICLRAASKKELDMVTTLMESTLAAKLFMTKTARYQQIEALQSVLPRSDDQLQLKRNLDSTSAALTFPFISSEIVQPSGILYGINKSNDSLVIIDRFSLNNANSIVFAQSGSGKSYLSKIEILRHLSEGTKVIVIDPEREYSNLSESVNGTYVKLSANSNHHINPFDLPKVKYLNKEVAQHIQDLTTIISLMVGGLNSREKAAVDKSIIKLYKLKTKKIPTIEDFYDQLIILEQFKLCERLEKFTSGSLKNVFNCQTNIDLKNRLIVFDIKDLPDSLRQVMMLIVANFVSNTVKTRPEKRLLVIDEAWLLLQEQDSARFISGLVRRARKYFLGVSIITQQANDFLDNEYGRAIASQSALRILMRQDSTTIKKVVSEFNLSEFEHNYLLTTDRGECLMIVDQNHVAVKVISSKHEHPLITTNPKEIYQT